MESIVFERQYCEIKQSPYFHAKVDFIGKEFKLAFVDEARRKAHAES